MHTIEIIDIYYFYVGRGLFSFEFPAQIETSASREGGGGHILLVKSNFPYTG
jgi:hypothetical protein